MRPGVCDHLTRRQSTIEKSAVLSAEVSPITAMPQKGVLRPNPKPATVPATRRSSRSSLPLNLPKLAIPSRIIAPTLETMSEITPQATAPATADDTEIRQAMFDHGNS